MNTFSTGLNRDSGDKFRPNSSWPFALNAINVSRNGNKSSIINEEGNSICGNIPEGFDFIGHAESDSDLTYIYLTDNTISIIASIDNNCNYTELIRSSCLNFKNYHPISATYKQIDGCEPSLYWCDDFNIDAYVNLGELRRFIDEDATAAAYLADVGVLIPKTLPDQFYINQANIYDTWDCNKFKQVSDINVPVIKFSKILNTGGTLPAGSIQLVARYIDLDNNKTDWFSPTLPIPIVEESYYGPYNCIDGCEPDITTNKALEYTITNMDTSYPYIEYAYIHTNNSIQTAYLEGRFSTSNLTVTITGKQLQQIDVNDINVSTAKWIQSAYTLQHQNRLIKLDVKERKIDHTAFTRAALNIKSKYFIVDVQHNHPEYGIKTPYYYSTSRGYMRDEVYAFAVQWIFKDGTKTPAYHIPNRAKNKNSAGTTMTYPGLLDTNAGKHIPGNWDSTTYNAALSLGVGGFGWSAADVKHLQDAGYADNEIERWMVYNTALPDDTPEPSSNGSGELAYYESRDSIYPSIYSCDGTRVYEELAGTPIRYHKMPDATLEPLHYRTNPGTNDELLFTRSLGMQFWEVFPPAEYADDVQGYVILRAKVTPENQSIISKGVMWNGTMPFGDVIVPEESRWWRRKGTVPVAGSVVDINRQYVEFWSNETTFSRADISAASVFKFENEISASRAVLYLGSCDHGAGGYRYKTYYEASFKREPLTPAYGHTNRPFQTSGYIPLNSVIEGSEFSNTIGNVRRETKYMVEFNTTYQPNHPIISASDEFGNNQAYAYYASAKRFLPNQYGNIDGLIYYACGNMKLKSDPLYGFSIIFGGDTFITQLNFRRFDGTNLTASADNYHEFDFSELDGSCATRNDTISICAQSSLNNLGTASHTRCFIESRINSDLRHNLGTITEVEMSDSTDEVDDGYLPKAVCNKTAFDEDDYYVEQIAKAWQVDNTFEYNTDFSTENITHPQFPLSFTFDYCSECQNIYPYRWVWSEPSFGQEKEDNFRIFLVNNFKDLPQHKGKLITGFIKNHQLFFLTEKALFMQPTNDQTFSTNENVLYVGTGDFGVLDAKEVISTQHGYAGSVSKWATKVTEAGAFWPDINQGKVFVLSNQINSISEIGMESWFTEKMTNSFANTWLDLTGSPYLLEDTPQAANGVGALITYDPRYRRIILTYKDYEITPRAQSLIANGNLIYNVEEGEFELLVPDALIGLVPDPDGGSSTNRYASEKDDTSKVPSAFGTRVYARFNIEDIPQYFQIKNFTVSFSLHTNTWISFHSYIPSYMFNTNRFFFTSANNGLWKHGERNFQTYYGIKWDHIIEYTTTENFRTQKYDSIQYISDVQDYDGALKSWVDVPMITFNKGILYTDTQSTGKINIIPAEDSYVTELLYNAGDITAHRHDRNWKLNKIRDMVIDYNEPLFREDAASLLPEYFIDKIPNANATSNSKSLYEQGRIRNKFCNVRLFFKPLNDYRIMTDVVTTMARNSIR